MRIRKRPVPFLLPVAVSDPLLNLNRPPPVPVVVQLGHHDIVSPQNPDHPIGHGSCTDGRDLISDKEDHKEKRVRPEFLFKDQDEKEKGNDIRKENMSSAQTISGFQHKPVSPKFSSPSQVPIPPKKRSRGNNNITNNDTTSPKTTRSAKKSAKNDDVYGGGDDDYYGEIGIKEPPMAGGHVAAAGKKIKAAGRGGALMEGSRCSRVNGRGWRCCQQTLVGYSLCEHHLGKGRLRSMTSVRSRSLPKPATTPFDVIVTHTFDTTTAAHASVQQAAEAAVVVSDGNDDKEGIDYKETRDYDPKMITKSGGKKRRKLGMVKARSISSLLGQTSTNSSTNTTTGATSMADHDQYSK